ncbi:MAG: TIGR00282 family metallophosphoesterase, partial [Candidatus Omnitrophica bacterium]|nr:TIGR00282 family metallophosphoesterase [Candidatus Omnitrophota bacterium]
MKVLFLGDIVGAPGREVVQRLVPAMKRSGEVDFVIADAENAAAGSGIVERNAQELFHNGVDVITLGDHVWDRREVYPYLNESERVLRPANFVKEAPGRGTCCVEMPNGVKIGVVSLLGRTFMKMASNCPFRTLDDILTELSKETKIIFIDFHAETTSEKVTMGWYADGRVTAVCGTHTHIQTADEKILPKGTAFITDLGMTGPYDSVIGQKKELIIERFLMGMPTKFEVAETPATMCGVIIDVDEKTGR